ncbi:MAG: hypothetical protein R3C45_10655 [Phycisphaerales bacterium]
MLTATASPDLVFTENHTSTVIYGKTTGFNAEIDANTLDATDGLRLVDTGEEDIRTTRLIGDVNGDGFEDLAINTSERYTVPTDNGVQHKTRRNSYVVFGNQDGLLTQIDLATINGVNGFELLNPDEEYTIGIVPAGDVNNDGFADMVLGTGGADPHGIFDAGRAYLVFGSAGGYAPVIDLTTLDGAGHPLQRRPAPGGRGSDSQQRR